MTPCETRSVASTGATTRCSGPARCAPCGVAPRSPSATGPVTWPGAPSSGSCATWVCTASAAPSHRAPPGPHRRGQCPADLVNRHFAAFRPNELWVSDITYVRTFSGWVYVAFVTDVYSRRVIGRRTSTSPCADLAAGALEMAVWARRREGADLTGPGPPLRPRGGVPGHPLRADPGPVRGGRLGGLQGGLLSASLWPRPSTPCTRPSSSATRAPGRASTMSGPATAQWVHWYNTVRPHCAIGMRTPAEHEAARVPDTDHQEQPQPATTGTN